jgi:hypothetical protein
MDYFKKLPGFNRSASGIEWQVLRKLPWILLLGTLLPAVFVYILYLSDLLDPKLLDKVIIITIAVVILHWTLMTVVGFAAFIVMIMKGPAYVADPYYPPDFKDCDDDEDPIREL